MATYRWTEHRDSFSRSTGNETPGAQLEQDMIAIFREHPATVVASMNQVITAYDEGKVNSGWAVLRRHVEGALKTESVTADDSREKQRAIKRAETWMKHSGIHYDRETEIIAELFGHAGILEPFNGDPALEQRMVALWREARPTGEAIEKADRDADAEFAERHKCPNCGKLRSFLTRPCQWCQHDARMANVLATLETPGATGRKSQEAVEAERRQDQAEPCDTAAPVNTEPAPQPHPDEEPL